ncbi:MAG: alpha-amylase family glycosyl hydrolase [Spirochaetia bacterium]|jgi:glycosidase|nr:alpha-amylase family glycosyl hydrolase [Spirochaetia bacterium]
MGRWYKEALFYQFYPLAFARGPYSLAELEKWADHLVSLGIDAVYLGPVFQSESHGYDTDDYLKVDRRLGDNQTLRNLVHVYHCHGIKVILDAVFNHTGRGFHAFRDLQEKGRGSLYAAWYKGVDFSKDNHFGDGFCYQGWEGCDDLALLDLTNPQVSDYLIQVAKFWKTEFHIDGLRLDCAYSLPKSFLSRLNRELKESDPDFFLLGEVIHGNYADYVGKGMLDSVTDYELHQGLFHSHVSSNYFELAHTLTRQFIEEGSVGYRLYNFTDNHDVDRLASKVTDSRDLYLIYALLYYLPGLPSLYYGDEWGAEGKKVGGDDASLRPWFDIMHLPIKDRQLLNHIRTFAFLRRKDKHFFACADLSVEVLENQFLVLRRTLGEKSLFLMLNIDEKDRNITLPQGGKVLYGCSAMGSEGGLDLKSHGFSLIDVSRKPV